MFVVYGPLLLTLLTTISPPERIQQPPISISGCLSKTEPASCRVAEVLNYQRPDGVQERLFVLSSAPASSAFLRLACGSLTSRSQTNPFV